MGKLFGVILVLLVIVIGSEVYFLTLPGQKKTAPRAALPSSAPVAPTTQANQPPLPTASPEILAEAERWRSQRPTNISNYQTKSYGKIFNVQADLVKKEGDKINAQAENDQKLTFVTDTKTQFFSRRGKEGKDFTQTLETTPFPLREGHVYLFEWQVDKNNNSSSIINLWRISSFLD